MLVLVKVLVKILGEICVLVMVGGAIRESTGSMSRDLTSSIKGPRWEQEVRSGG